MQFSPRRVESLFCGALICALLFPPSSRSQTAFVRDDAFDIQGSHTLKVVTDPDNFTPFVTTNSDFPHFKLNVKKSDLYLTALPTIWIPQRYKIDIDGNTVVDWTADDERNISYQFPNPDGLSATHSVGIQVDYIDLGGHRLPTLSGSASYTVFAKPRVYKDSDGNSFVQLRNEDATAKIPVLMVEGFDPLNEKFAEEYYNLTWELVNTDLIPNGYEVFILNFHDGGRDLRLNAEVVVKALEKVHEICPNYKIALAGLSMGGPIARYALAKSEGLGGTHDVGLFLSYDSPQGKLHSVHVSPNMQDWIYTLNPNIGAVAKMQASLQSVAAKQMLTYNTYDRDRILHDQFYDDLNARNGDGYPHQSYNVAVSNGNFIATPGYGSEGRHLMTLKINDNLINQVPAVRLDCGTGSKISNITMRRFGDLFPNPFLSVYYDLEIIFNPSYEMTYSALDLVNAQVDNLTGDIVSFDRSKFDDYVVQTTPLQHHQLSVVTRNKIVEWLNRNFNITVNYNLLEGGSVTPDVYSVRILHETSITVPPKTVNVNGQQITYAFSNWEDGSMQNPRTFYTSQNVSHTATMKAHLRTSVPSLSDAKNQRRVVSNESGVWVMVYESAGDIWITQSNDNGATWYLEQRLNFTQGSASNPTLGNMFRYATYGQTERVAVCWVEQSGGQTVAYLQTITPSTYGIMYGWLSPSYERAATSYGLLSNFGGIARGGARPVLWLEQSGNDILLQYAMEVANSGIKTAKILFRGNGSNTMYDDVAGGATLVSFSSRNVSSNTSDVYPVIIAYPSAFGYAAKSYVYYLGFGYASGNRIVQYDYGTGQSLLLPTAYGDYSYYSLQGAVNPTSASFGLVAEAFNNDRLCVNYYSKPTYYGSSAPSLATVYTNIRQPTLMAEKVQSFGSAIVEINLSSTGEEDVWYKSNGSPSVEYLGSSIAGIFAREHVFSGDRATMAIRTNTSPAAIERFTGEGGDVEARSAAFAFYSDGTTSGMAMLDLDGAQAETIDSLQADQTLVAMKFYSSAAGGDLARQADSLAIPLRVDLSRNGVLIRSIPASRWTRLTTQSLPQFRNGDVLSFRLSGKGKRQWGYRQVNVQHASTAKAVNKKESVALPTQFAIQQNYPNPFNPVTTIAYDLPEASYVSLIVYDVLGRQVAELVSGVREAGYHSATWNAEHVASGVYFVRFTASDASGTVRLNKVSKLLLTK